MKNKIILTANCEFKDEELREQFQRLETKIDTINERTKSHTLRIKELEKRK